MTPQLKYTSLLWLPSSYKLVNYDSLELIFPRKFRLPLVYNDSSNFSRTRKLVCLILRIPEKSNWQEFFSCFFFVLFYQFFNPFSASDALTRDEDAQIPALTLLPIPSEILKIGMFKLLSHERALNFLSNGGLVFKFGSTNRAIALFEVWLTEENSLLKKAHFWKLSGTQRVKDKSQEKLFVLIHCIWKHFNDLFMKNHIIITWWIYTHNNEPYLLKLGILKCKFVMTLATNGSESNIETQYYIDPG